MYTQKKKKKKERKKERNVKEERGIHSLRELFLRRIMMSDGALVVRLMGENVIGFFVANLEEEAD